MRFIEWNWKDGIATEYERTGECNQCGECCKRLVFIQSSHPQTGGCIMHMPQFEDEGVEPRQDNPERYTWQFIVTDKPNVCPMLENDLCSVHENKPAFCGVFPSRPKDIQNLKDCSYEFEVIQQWEFDYD